ncbi:MAG: hypothetical protein V2A61_00005, partial [Calditrichota bacterium]
KVKVEVKAEIEGGVFSASGVLMLSSGDNLSPNGGQRRPPHCEFDWDYNNALQVGDSSRFFKAGDKNLHLSGVIKRKSGAWSGSGEGTVQDSRNEELLLSSFILENKRINLQVRTPSPDNYITVTLTKTAPPFPFKITGRNLDHIIKAVGREDLIPSPLEKFNFDVDGSGRMDSVAMSFVVRRGTHRRTAVVECSAQKSASRKSASPKSDWSGGGRFWLDTPQAGLLIGSFDHSFSADALTLSDIILGDSQGRRLLTANVCWDDKTASLPTLDLEIQDLPYVSMLQLLWPETWIAFSGNINGKLHSQSDTLNINLNGFLIYPDSTQIEAELQGQVTDREVLIKNLSCEDPINQETLLRFQGGCNFSDGNIYESKLILSQFPVERLAQILIPQVSARPQGQINGRLTAKGPYLNPDLQGDFHLNRGIFNDSTGYWMNLQVESSPELYLVNSFSLGRNLKKLFKGRGQLDRSTRKFKANINGTAIDYQAVETMLKGSPGPLWGVGDLDLAISGPEPLQARLSTKSTQGRIGPLGFDKLNASATLEGGKARNYILQVDSISFDWGDSWSRISGSIPLSGPESWDVTLEAQGRLTGLLPRMTNFFSKPKGDGSLNLHLGGSSAEPHIDYGRWEIRNGGFEMNKVVESIEKLQVLVEMDSSREIHIQQFQGETDGRKFTFSNRFPAPDDLSEPIIIGGYNLGVLQFSTEGDGIWMTIPGLMKPIWGGSMTFTGLHGKGAFEFQGPVDHPRSQGEVHFRSATFTYPLLKGTEKPPLFVHDLLHTLETMRWDAYIIPEWGNRYQNELGGLRGKRLPGEVRKVFSSALDYVDISLFLDLLIDNDPEGLHFSGSLADTLRVDGELTSSRGSLEYLDLKFQVEKLGLQFNPLDPYPILYGTAVTTYIDTSGVPRDIRLAITRESNLPGDLLQPELETRGRWGDIRIRLADDQGHSQEQILAMLGYAPEFLGGKLSSLGGVVLESAVPMRQWTRFVEQKMERWLRVDQFEIEPTVTKNWIDRKLNPTPSLNGSEMESFNYITAWDRSQVTVGKALTRNLFVSYTGSLLSGTNSYNVTRLGVVHTWDLRLRLRWLAPNLNLNYRYLYDSLAELDDHSVRISYSFYLNL